MGLIYDLYNLLAPRYCVMCGRLLYVAEKDFICLDCNMDLPRTYLWREAETNKLARRFWGKANVVRVAAYLYYFADSNTARLFHAFKYHDRPRVARYMGRMMAMELRDSGFFDGIDCLVPIPISKKRRKKRGYNQSDILAEGVADVIGVPVRSDIVVRHTDNITQTRLSVYERVTNTDGIYELTAHADEIAGMHCLIIDDMVTTGSTTSACAREIQKIRGTSVSVLSLGCVKDVR